MSDVALVPFWRRLLAGVAGIGGGLALGSGVHASGAELIPTFTLFVAAFVIHVPRLGPQLLARATWWANLGLGAFICVLASSSEITPLLCTVLCAFALLAIGSKGLGEAGERGGYAPAAFKSSLLLLMVLALADAQSFLLFSVLVSRDADQGGLVAVLLLATAAYAIGFVGLYRLAPWGAILNLATSLVVFVVCASGIVRMVPQLRQIFCVLSIVHVLAAAPMLIALFSGRALPRGSPRVRGVAGSGVIVVIVALSAMSSFGWITFR